MHSIPFLAVNGGHGEIKSLGDLHNVIQITIRALKNIAINGNTATIQGGTGNLNITTALWNAKKQTGMLPFSHNQSFCADIFRLPQ